MKNTISEMKNTLEGINSRLDEAEDWIGKWEDKSTISTWAEHEKQERNKRNEESLRNLCDDTKHDNIHIIGIPEGEESISKKENLFEETMVENVPNLVKEIDTQVQEAQRVSSKMNLKRLTPRHIIIKMQKVKGKESISKVAREKS